MRRFLPILFMFTLALLYLFPPHARGTRGEVEPQLTATAVVTATNSPTSMSLLPDLVVQSMSISLERTDCHTPGEPLGVRVMLKNSGGTAAGPFDVDVNAARQRVSGGLAAGQTIGLWFSGYNAGANTAIVDSSDLVAESNETNNERTEVPPIPTPPVPCTPTPTVPAEGPCFQSGVSCAVFLPLIAVAAGTAEPQPTGSAEPTAPATRTGAPTATTATTTTEPTRTTTSAATVTVTATGPTPTATNTATAASTATPALPTPTQTRIPTS